MVVTEEKTSQVAKKIETAANFAIIIAAAAIIFIFVRNYTRKPITPPTIALGAKFALKNESWQSSQKNIVLAVSTTCHFCTESAGFYRELVKQCKQQNVRTIAVLPQSTAEAESYLKNEGVVVDEIRQSTLSDLEISGTPTLVLVGGDGTVKKVWVGKLADDQEKEVLGKLGS
jgi:peroxiredoxin